MILTYASESPYNPKVVGSGGPFPFGLLAAGWSCVLFPLDLWLLEGAAALSLWALSLCHELLG